MAKRYRIGWISKKATSYDDPRRSWIDDFKSGWQDSEKVVQAWVDKLNTDFPEIHHFVERENS